MNAKNMHGLTVREVAARQRRDGYNELPDREKRSIFGLVFSILTEPMIFLLLAVVVVYFLLGDRSEAIVVMV